MKNLNSNVACAGMDVHYKFSNVTFRDAGGKVVRRQRLAHPDRRQLAERLSRWPTGIPVAMEASFGWGWLSDLLEEAGQKDVDYQAIAPVRPGCDKKKSRSETGQLLHPMVHASTA